MKTRSRIHDSCRIRRPLFERLEARRLLAADVVISEFLASNQTDFVDGFGDSSDWIELYNQGDDGADLTGYHLTDDVSNLSKWTFPVGTTLGAEEYMVVFASGRSLTTTDAKGYLHADFKLSADGEYLALTDSTQPQPRILAEFADHGHNYPKQRNNVSYGIANNLDFRPLIGPAHPVTVHIPNSDVLGKAWTGSPQNEPFDDSPAAGWTAGKYGVGYDRGPTTNVAAFGNAVINRPSRDTASGSIFSLTSSPFTTPGTLARWSMFSDIADRTITPLILKLHETGEFEITGIGATRTSTGGGKQSFDFAIQSGEDFVGETYFFGWKDGSNGISNPGVADFTDGASEEVRWFRRHTDFALGDALGDGRVFSRAYSFQLEVESRFYDGEIQTSVPIGTTMAYLRSEFHVEDPRTVDSLTLRVKYDDGIVVFLNGDEVFRDLAPTLLMHNSTATGSRDDGLAVEYQAVDISDHKDKLLDGRNVLAVQALNGSSDSSDLLAVVELDGGHVDSRPVGYMLTPTPAAPNTDGFRGFVADTTFSVERGYYTSEFDLQVSNATPGATLVYTTDGSTPSLTHGTQVFSSPTDTPSIVIPITTTTTLRAATFKEGFQPSDIETHTYLFVAQVLQQRGLYRNVTQNAIWGPLLDDSLLSVPTISLVTPHTISQTEQETSVELINPDGRVGFQIDAGIEHYGGHSINSPKKNMRLSFKSIYGASKLKYPVYDDSNAVAEFDQLLLRSGSHDTWFWTHPAGQGGVYFRNRWAYERQLEMGHLAPHGRYVQVYINGRYEGLHNLMERPNADFMASYLGGSDDDYDALNAGNVIDGSKRTWNSMVRAIRDGDWSLVQRYMDVENYIDYMLLEFYGGNDWDWGHAQNWSAATQKGDGDGYQFFPWDSDLKMRTTPIANVVSLGGPGDLWGAITQIPEFRLLFADHVQKHFYHDGVFTPDRVLQQIDALAAETELPVIAETARWSSSYTPDTWRGYVDWIRKAFVPRRTRIVLRQLRSYLPTVDAPTYRVNGQEQYGGTMQPSSLLSIQADAGDVYYTTDGSDPRGEDGQPTGRLFQSAIPIHQTTKLKARIFFEGEWSALSEATFFSGDLLGDVNHDQMVDASDLDALFAAIAQGSSEVAFDMNQDGEVTPADVDVLVQEVLATRRGDFDLNGRVDFGDFLQLSASFGKQQANWTEGDTNGDGTVSLADFLAFSLNFGYQRDV